MSLVIRKRKDGSVTIEGEPPVEHIFPAGWIARELGELVSVTIELRSADGVHLYRFDGFDTLDDGRPNFTGWRATLEAADLERGD